MATTTQSIALDPTDMAGFTMRPPLGQPFVALDRLKAMIGKEDDKLKELNKKLWSVGTMDARNGWHRMVVMHKHSFGALAGSPD
jgi:hypothetical protein